MIDVAGIVTVQVQYNGTVLQANVMTPEAGSKWITDIVAALLAKRPLEMSDELAIRRTS